MPYYALEMHARVCYIVRVNPVSRRFYFIRESIPWSVAADAREVLKLFGSCCVQPDTKKVASTLPFLLSTYSCRILQGSGKIHKSMWCYHVGIYKDL